MKKWCKGPIQDDTGAWYCPREPEIDDYDCDRCHGEYQAWCDLMNDLKIEEGKDSWG